MIDVSSHTGRWFCWHKIYSIWFNVCITWLVVLLVLSEAVACCSKKRGSWKFRKILRLATLLKETPTTVFSCEFCEIFKNTFFHKAPPVAASILCPSSVVICLDGYFKSTVANKPFLYEGAFIKYLSIISKSIMIFFSKLS